MKLVAMSAALLLLGAGCGPQERRAPEPGGDTTSAVAGTDTTAPESGAGKADAAAPAHPIAPHEIEQLRRRGLHDPIPQLVEDLQKHAEVLPDSGVLGGRLGFYDPEGIHVLDSRWVYARFDDGHIGGSGVFEFAIQPDGSLVWKVVSARMDH
jgi:hypothetical protein